MATETPITIERDRRGRPLPPPGVAPTSLKWAAIVPVAALIVLALFIIVNSMDSPERPPLAPVPKIQKASGLTVKAGSPFTPFIVAGEPPPDILNTLVIPTGVTLIRTPHTGGSATSFDHTLVYSSPASAQSLYTFFHNELRSRGWRIFSSGPPVNHPGVEMLAQKAGSDSWYWEAGVIVSPTKFKTDGSQSTEVTIRLYQASSDA
jgi:hypothetical protein